MSEVTTTTTVVEGPIVDDTIGLFYSLHARPEDEDLIALAAMYKNATGQPMIHKTFFIRKDDAKILAERLALILAAPDTRTAWQQIADGVESDEYDFEPGDKEEEVGTNDKIHI